MLKGPRARLQDLVQSFPSKVAVRDSETQTDRSRTWLSTAEFLQRSIAQDRAVGKQAKSSR